VDPRAGLDDVKERKFLTLPALVQPVASRYTDYAIPDPVLLVLIYFIILFTYLHTPDDSPCERNMFRLNETIKFIRPLIFYRFY
jgi:hypothetical protein